MALLHEVGDIAAVLAPPTQMTPTRGAYLDVYLITFGFTILDHAVKHSPLNE